MGLGPTGIEGYDSKEGHLLTVCKAYILILSMQIQGGRENSNGVHMRGEGSSSQ